MNTRGSDSAAPKSAKKDRDQKSRKATQKAAVPKVESHPPQPPKPLPSEETKASGSVLKQAPKMDPIVVTHTVLSPDDPPRRSIFKGTFNTHDIMHAPVEKTIQMLDKILAGERLFTM